MLTIKWKKTPALSVFIFVSASFAGFFPPGLYFTRGNSEMVKCYTRIFWSVDQGNHLLLEINGDVTFILLGLMFK